MRRSSAMTHMPAVGGTHAAVNGRGKRVSEPAFFSLRLLEDAQLPVRLDFVKVHQRDFSKATWTETHMIHRVTLTDWWCQCWTCSRACVCVRYVCVRESE